MVSELQHLKLEMVGGIFLRVLSAGVREFPGGMAGMPTLLRWLGCGPQQSYGELSAIVSSISCSGGRFSSRSIHPVHPVSLDLYSLLVTQAACLMYGSNTVVPYSSKDLIQGMYAK